MKVCTGTSGSGIRFVLKSPKCPVTVLMSYRSYRRVRYRYCVRPNLPKCPISELMYRTYRSVWYRYLFHIELTGVSGTCIDVVPNLPKCLVPVLLSYRTCRSVRYRYPCLTERTEVSGTGMKACTGTGGTGIHVLPNVPKCPVSVLMYRTYRSVQYRY